MLDARLGDRPQLEYWLTSGVVDDNETALERHARYIAARQDPDARDFGVESYAGFLALPAADQAEFDTLGPTIDEMNYVLQLVDPHFRLGE